MRDNAILQRFCVSHKSAKNNDELGFCLSGRFHHLFMLKYPLELARAGFTRISGGGLRCGLQRYFTTTGLLVPPQFIEAYKLFSGAGYGEPANLFTIHAHGRDFISVSCSVQISSSTRLFIPQLKTLLLLYPMGYDLHKDVNRNLPCPRPTHCIVQDRPG